MPNMSGDLLQRARLLRDRKRFQDAIAMLHEYLASEPESFNAYYELAVTRVIEGVDYRQGLLEIDRAIALSPDSGPAHSMRSALLHAQGRFQDALLAAGTAKGFDPNLPYAWFCEANALLCMGAYPGAEKAARKALEIDPDHPSASSVLIGALRLQDRFSEAEEVSEIYLGRNLESPSTMANAGWVALNQGQRDKAEELFREALRLKPGLELGRLGLRDAFKSRSLFYRLYLRHEKLFKQDSDWIKNLSFISMIVSFASVWVVLVTVHPLAVGAFLVSFPLVFGPWLANSVGHLLILKDRLARHSLNRGEKLDGPAVGALLFGGVLVLLIGAVMRSAGVATLGGALMGTAVPMSFIFTNPSAKGRVVFSAMALSVIACGIAVLLLGPDRPVSWVLVFVAMVVVFATPRTSMKPSLRRKKPG